jgi:2-iminobutanoate/2-iminopropanoate deaminase
MTRITTTKAPQAIGPYSQGILSGAMLFTSGQIALDPATGSLVSGGIQAETRQVLENLKAVLEAGGVSLKDVVKTTVFLADLSEFASMNEIYAAYFSAEPPARSTVGVASLPRGARVEIEAIAVRHKASR